MNKIGEQLGFVEWLKDHRLYNYVETDSNMQKMFQVYRSQQAEIKKLRYALEEIVNYKGWITKAEDAFNMQRIAIEALKDGE